MIRALALLFVAAALGAAGSGVLASNTTHPTAGEAAEAAFVELLPDWNIAGECNTAVTPAPEDVCYRFAPGRSTEDYSIYSAHAFMVTDVAWWVGVVETNDGWKPYGGGLCDVFYCRMMAPSDVLLLGFPSGDVNCDDAVDSRDATLILQVVAELLPKSGVVCFIEANVTADESSSRDALAILQSAAGLIGPLPVIVPPYLG